MNLAEASSRGRRSLLWARPEGAHQRDESTDMPKQKTRKGVAKRFKTTGTGKVKRRKAFARHLMTDKAAKRKRQLRHGTTVAPVDAKRIRSMLPST